MMKIILTSVLVILALSSFCQIQVKESKKKVVIGEVKSGNYMQVELSYIVSGSDSMYMILYRNEKYTRITDFQAISFHNTDNTVGKLYDVIKLFFTDDEKKNPNYKMEIKIGDTDIVLSYFMDEVMVFTDKGYFFLSAKELESLFGRS